MPIGRIHRPGRRRQLMPKRFRLSRQKYVVGHKPHVVLDHAQPLPGTIQRGVDDSEVLRI